MDRQNTVTDIRPFINNSYIDNNSSFFQVYDFPKKFGIGKNYFRLQANNEMLVKGTSIYINIYDANNDRVYYEVLKTKGEDNSRIVVVYITPETAPGNITIYIAGTTDVIHPINIMWIGQFPISLKSTTTSNIFFESYPIVEVTERVAVYKEKTAGVNHLITKNGASGNKISIHPIQSPIDFTGDTKFALDGNENRQKEPVDSDSVSKVFSTTSGNQNVTFGKSIESRQLPEFNPLPVISTTLPFFSKSMEGGELIIKNISLASNQPRDVSNITAFANIPTFTANIIEVIDSKKAKVDQAFSELIEYELIGGGRNKISINQFSNHSNFTASYYSKPTLTNALSSESFAAIDFKQLTPAAGNIDKIRIKYKPIGSFGDYVDTGEYAISPINILSDRLVYELTDNSGFIEKPIGAPESITDIKNYWISGSVGGTISCAYSSNNPGGISITNTVTGTTNYGFIRSKSPYYFEGVENTEYTLKLNYVSDSDSLTSPQIDIYVSGSGITSGIVNNSKITSPLKILNFGTYINSITPAANKRGLSEFKFKVLDDGFLTVSFVLRSGNWTLSNIEVLPTAEIGITPNQYRLNIPVQKLSVNSELTLLTEYYGNDNIKASAQSQIRGVYFSGSYRQSVSNTSSLVTKTTFNNYTGSRYGAVTLNYVGNLIGKSNAPKMIGLVAFPTRAIVTSSFLYISSSTPFQKINFYVTSGSIYEPYNPSYVTGEFRAGNDVGSFEIFPTASLNYTGSVVTTSGWKVVGNTVYDTIKLFASSSGATQPDNNCKIIFGLIFRAK